MVGHVHPNFGRFLHGGGADGPILRIGDVCDVPMQREDDGRFLPPVDIPTDTVAAETAGGWELGVPTIGNGDSGCRTGVGGKICLPLL